MANDLLLIRCSSLGRIMTNAREVDPSLMTPELAAIKAKTKRSDDEKALLADALSRSLSETAKSHIRILAAQAIYGVEFEISSKAIEKGLELEPEAIALVNRVRGLALVKNTERRSNGYLTGEADCFDAGPRIGHDTKVAWSVATFPIVLADCYDDDYLWQMRGYMMLWDAEEWHVDYALLDTPEHLIGYEPQSMHFVSHIPEHMRLTSWVVKRDRSVEPLICAKVELARKYLAEVIAEFDRTHLPSGVLVAKALDAIAGLTDLAPVIRAPGGPFTLIEPAPAKPPRDFRRSASVRAPTPLAEATPAELRNEWALFEHSLGHVMPVVEKHAAAVDTTRFMRAVERMRAIFLANEEVQP